MASLESLKNPVQRLGVLGTAASQTASFRRNEVGNADIWDATKQYYLNDIAFSAIDGGAYVFSGGATVGTAAPVTCILGGNEPADDWFNPGPPPAVSVWTPLGGYGARVVESPSTLPQSATLVAGGAITFTNCALIQADVGNVNNFPLGNTNYMAHVQMAVTFGAVALAADWFNLTLTPTGGTVTPARSVTVTPAVGVALQNVSVSVYVPLATDGTTTSIALTGAMNSGSTQTGTISNVVVTYVPLVP
jgi:hypothetical protein